MLEAPSRALGKRLAFILAAIGIVAALLATDVSADPAADALVELTELSRLAEQTTEQIHTAQIDLDEKLAAQQVAEKKAASDRATVDVASADLATYQAAVDTLAASAYMGGRTDTLAAALTATSPQDLIDQLAIQKTVASELTVQMAAFRSASTRAAAAADQSSKSAAQARIASDEAAAVRTDLDAKQRRMQEQIAAVQARYEALTPDQRAILADPGPPPPPLPPSSPANDPSIVAMPGPADGGSFGGGTAVVQAALTRVGSPYSWGATGPDAFDCSGLIKWAFLQNGKSLPRSSQALAQGGQGAREFQHPFVFRAVAHLAEAGVIAVLLAATGVAAGRLDMAVSLGTDPDVGPRRRNHQVFDALRGVVIGEEFAVGTVVGKPLAAALPDDARRIQFATCEPHNRGPLRTVTLPRRGAQSSCRPNYYPCSGLQYDLDGTVLLVLEDVVGVRRLVQGKHMGGERVHAQGIGIGE